MIHHKTKSIFIHIGKTGGTSIEYKLNPNVPKCDKVPGNSKLPDKHWTALEYKNRYPEYFKKYTKFTFVRNPWDHQVSLFKWFKRLNKKWGFDEFIKTRAARKRMGYFQYMNDKNGECLVDFVGRFENLQQDYDKICEILHLPKSQLSHKNKSDITIPYSDYYTDETKDIVSKHYAQEILKFGYTFE